MVKPLLMKKEKSMTVLADIEHARREDLIEAMTVAEAKAEIERLTAAICHERIQVAITKLHLEIINKASLSAHTELRVLATAISELEDCIYSQDFMDLRGYVEIAKANGDYVPEDAAAG
jgi:hypothetical protein